MKMRRTRWLLALLLVVVGLRFTVLVSRCDLGWETIALEWKSGALGWFGWEYRPIRERKVLEQAEFWLAQIDKVLARHPNDPQIVMGAALILDAPGDGFVDQYPSRTRHDQRADWNAIRADFVEFEKRCRRRSLALAARATELAPDDVHLWRLRALLQFPYRSYYVPFRYVYSQSLFEPISTNWRAVLEKASQRDSDAYCDYMMAIHFWMDAADIDHHDNGYRVTKNDPQLFMEGSRCFEQGLSKPSYSFIAVEIAPLEKFLVASDLPKTEIDDCLLETRISDRRGRCMGYLGHWQAILAKSARSEDEPKQAGEYIELSKRWSETISKTKGPNRQSRSYDQPRDHVVTPLLHDVPELTVATLVAFAVATLVILLGCRSGRQAARILTPTTIVCTWAFCMGMSFVVFGLAPAELVLRPVQACAAILVVALPLIAGIGWITYRVCGRALIEMIRSPGLQQRQAAVNGISRLCLWSLVVIAPVCAYITLRLQAENAADFPSISLDEIYIGPLGERVRRDDDKWEFAVVQWSRYHGIYVAALSTLGLLAIWQAAGLLRNERSLSVRQMISSFLVAIRRSIATISACLLVAYALIAPTVVLRIEDDYQQNMTRIRNLQNATDDAIAK